MENIDQIDRHILNIVQREGDLPQRQLAERVGLSPNACWSRLQKLRSKGILVGTRAIIDREKVGLSLVVFVMLRTRHHSATWLNSLREHVSQIPEIVDFHRIGGDYDYLLKVITYDMSTFDHVYQRLISGVEFDAVTSYFVMEAVHEDRPLLVGADQSRET